MNIRNQINCVWTQVQVITILTIRETLWRTNRAIIIYCLCMTRWIKLMWAGCLVKVYRLGKSMIIVLMVLREGNKKKRWCEPFADLLCWTFRKSLYVRVRSILAGFMKIGLSFFLFRRWRGLVLILARVEKMGESESNRLNKGIWLGIVKGLPFEMVWIWWLWTWGSFGLMETRR